METCKWCKKCEGTHQLYSLDLATNIKTPTGKLWDKCWVAFKTPSKKLQKLLGQKPTDPPCKPTVVVVRGQKVVSADVITMTEWLCAGYTVIGVADTVAGVEKLKRLAREATG